MQTPGDMILPGLSLRPELTLQESVVFLVVSNLSLDRPVQVQRTIHASG